MAFIKDKSDWNDFNVSDEMKKNLEKLKELKELSDKGELGVYIITKPKPLKRWEQLFCKVCPSYKSDRATGRVLGTSDENGNMKPFTLEL